MTPRPHARTRRAALAALAGFGSVTLAAGCDPRALFYFLQPFEPTIAPPCPSLKGKKVVILTHVAAGNVGGFESVGAELSDGLAEALEQKVKKVEIVPNSKVRLWVDAHPGYTDPSEAGRAFEADAVVFLEVEKFQIQSPLNPGLFQGEAKVHVKVFELAVPTDEKGRAIEGQPREVVILHDDYVDSVFPKVQGSIPESATVNRNAFRKKFTDLVVAEVSWHFVEHTSGDNIQDTSF